MWLLYSDRRLAFSPLQLQQDDKMKNRKEEKKNFHPCLSWFSHLRKETRKCWSKPCAKTYEFCEQLADGYLFGKTFGL